MKFTSLLSALMLGTAALAIPLEKKQFDPSCAEECESSDDCCEEYECRAMPGPGTFSVCVPEQAPPFPSIPTSIPTSLPTGIPTSFPTGIPTDFPTPDFPTPEIPAPEIPAPEIPN